MTTCIPVQHATRYPVHEIHIISGL